MKFADKLRELRESKGITRQALADTMELSLPTIISWERGDRVPTFGTVLQLCKALGVRCTIFEGCDFGEAEGKPGRGRPSKKS
ncbi:helix-turn-helix transcriptional regulator [Sphingomonas sp.]|uniref:helix-turn-helix transcriptional regulator n=1 Tax=Sphingomonas sp. TaxID=28214 RepID=UPI0025E9EA27|nr:helix-turn-helix transcriptional regulator [Sphingomonas sp.]